MGGLAAPPSMPPAGVLGPLSPSVPGAGAGAGLPGNSGRGPGGELPAPLGTLHRMKNG